MTANRPLDIVQLCHGSLGGSSRAAGRLANALARRGHAVRLLSRVALPWGLEPCIAQQTLRASADEPASGLYWDWSEQDLAAFSDLLAEALTQRPCDLLHYHYAQPFAAVVARLAQRLGPAMPAVVGTLHGTDLTRCVGDTTATLRGALTATDSLTTVSQHLRALTAALRLPSPAVLPNFVEDDWPGGARQPPPRPVILHVSNFRAVKDLGLLARLYLAVHAQIASELWLVGDGPELPALRALLEHSPAAGDVRTLGAQAKPQPQFRAATLLLSTSQEEGFGLAVLEALASGTPVVATAVGGVPELVTDEKTGLLFAPEEVSATAARMVALLRAPGRLEAMSKACLAHAAGLRESQVIGRYEELYRATLSRRVGSPAA